MYRLHIGNHSEFVAIEIRNRRAIDKWVNCDVEVRVKGFRASISAEFEDRDFLRFENELRTLYDKLSGTARLWPRDEQLTLTLQGNGLGRIEVNGSAWYVACYGSKLEFEFEIDQSYLPAVLHQLSEIDKAFLA